MLTCTVLLRHPLNFQPFPLAGSGVCQEWLTVAVFMDRTLTHVCHTGPAEQSPKTNKKGMVWQISAGGLEFFTFPSHGIQYHRNLCEMARKLKASLWLHPRGSSLFWCATLMQRSLQSTRRPYRNGELRRPKKCQVERTETTMGEGKLHFCNDFVST